MLSPMAVDKWVSILLGRQAFCVVLRRQFCVFVDVGFTVRDW